MKNILSYSQMGVRSVQEIVRSRISILLCFVSVCCSCSKAPLDDPKYIGDWYGNSTATEYFLTINADGTGSFYWNKGGSVAGEGEVKIFDSHLKIGNSNFKILQPPTQMDTTFFDGKLVSWKMHLKYTAIFSSGEEMWLYKK